MKKKPAKKASSRRSPAKPKKPVAPKKHASAALSINDLVEVLKQGGSSGVTADSIRSDLKAGAPSNKDGTIDLVRYAAWLVSQDRK